MKSRRLSSVMHILIVASVFLFSACGIPTYIEPKISIKSVDSSTSLNFNVKYASENSGHANAEKIGLILFYNIDSGSLAGTQTSYVKSWFSKNARTTERDGVVVSPEYSKEIAKLKGTNDQEFDLYVFDKLHYAVTAPEYNYALDDSSGPINLEFRLSYDADNRVNMQVYENSVLSVSTILYLDADLTLDATDSFSIYGAVSVQSDNYSNLYWSDLTYIGALRTE